MQALRVRGHPIARQNARASDSGSRSITNSAPFRRALPFSLTTHNVQRDDRDERFMRMLMFGKPGAGKGTLTARLVEKYDVMSLSTGDLLRQHIAEGTDVGKEAEDIMARGKLLPDDVVLKVVASKLDRIQPKHWILDGFPRTLGQGKLLDVHLKKQYIPLTLVVNLDVPDDVILSRISNRWIHLPSGRVYNMLYNRPRVEGYDDVTGEPLTKRPDDNPEVFSRRLAAFYASTSPLLSYFSTAASSAAHSPFNHHQHPHQLSFHRTQKLAVKSLSGNTSDEIWPQLDQLVRNMFPGLRTRADTQESKRRHSLSDAIVAENLQANGSFK